jgi:hypothetical protein
MKKITKPKAIKDEYKVSVKVLGKTHEQTGISVSEALNKFNIRNVKGVRSILIVEHNGNKKERILMPMQTNRLFNSYGLMKEVQIKNCATLFQGL